MAYDKIARAGTPSSSRVWDLDCRRIATTSEMRVVDFVTDPGSDDSMDLAFNKKRADDRKRWLEAYDRSGSARERRQMFHKQFVDRELIHFSNYGLDVSAPKASRRPQTSQRKILYTAVGAS
jgi:DNA topoisomerase-2